HAPGIQAAQGANDVRHTTAAARGGGSYASVREDRMDVHNIKPLDIAFEPAGERRRVLDSLTPLPAEDNNRHLAVRNDSPMRDGQTPRAVGVGCCDERVDALLAQRSTHLYDRSARPTVPRCHAGDNMKDFHGALNPTTVQPFL